MSRMRADRKSGTTGNGKGFANRDPIIGNPAGSAKQTAEMFDSLNLDRRSALFYSMDKTTGVLVELAKHCRCKTIRGLAITELTGKVGELEDVDALILVAKKSNSKNARETAVSKLAGNNKALASVAKYSEHQDTREQAIEGINNPETLENVGMYALYEETRNYAYSRLEKIRK